MFLWCILVIFSDVTRREAAESGHASVQLMTGISTGVYSGSGHWCHDAMDQYQSYSRHGQGPSEDHPHCGWIVRHSLGPPLQSSGVQWTIYLVNLQVGSGHPVPYLPGCHSCATSVQCETSSQWHWSRNVVHCWNRQASSIYRLLCLIMCIPKRNAVLVQF